MLKYILLTLLLIVLARAETSSDYSKIQCRIVGWHVDNVDSSYKPLLHVDLIYSDNTKLFSTDGNLAQKNMDNDASEYNTESDADDWANSFTLNNIYDCWTTNSKTVMEKPDDLALILTLTLGIGIPCLLLLLPCILLLLIFVICLLTILGLSILAAPILFVMCGVALCVGGVIGVVALIGAVTGSYEILNPANGDAETGESRMKQIKNKISDAKTSIFEKIRSSKKDNDPEAINSPNLSEVDPNDGKDMMDDGIEDNDL